MVLLTYVALKYRQNAEVNGFNIFYDFGIIGKRIKF